MPRSVQRSDRSLIFPLIEPENLPERPRATALLEQRLRKDLSECEDHRSTER